MTVCLFILGACTAVLVIPAAFLWALVETIERADAKPVDKAPSTKAP